VKYFDISVPISPALPIYDGDPPIEISLWGQMAQGAIADVRTLRMGLHTGTHVDAPAHFLPGADLIDRLDLEACYGPAQVVDLTQLGHALVTPADLDGRLIPGVPRVLIRTTNSALWRRQAFQPSFVALSEEAACLLVERGVRLVGIDYLSVAPAADPAPVHRILLSAQAVILEGLDLSVVPEGRYTLICLPLRLEGTEAAPARAILIA
jgi:arylformamidase